MPKRIYDRQVCFLCGRSFECGPHLYKGRHIDTWNISVCQGCHSSPFGEVPPIYTSKVRRHLDERGIQYRRNSQGWIEWPL